VGENKNLEKLFKILDQLFELKKKFPKKVFEFNFIFQKKLGPPPFILSSRYILDNI